MKLHQQSLLMPFICATHQRIVAQAAYDSTYNSTYYQQKVTLFKLLPDTKTIFFWDSITDIGE